MAETTTFFIFSYFLPRFASVASAASVQRERRVSRKRRSAPTASPGATLGPMASRPARSAPRVPTAWCAPVRARNAVLALPRRRDPLRAPTASPAASRPCSVRPMRSVLAVTSAGTLRRRRGTARTASREPTATSTGRHACRAQRATTLRRIAGNTCTALRAARGPSVPAAPPAASLVRRGPSARRRAGSV